MVLYAIGILFFLYTAVFAQQNDEQIQDNISKSEAASDESVAYTVKDGDTFWDLAFEFVGDPYQWPDIWEGNPHIKNPNLIYPGDLVMISGRAGNDSSSTKGKAFSRRSGRNDSASVLSSNQGAKKVLKAIQDKISISSNFFSGVPFLWTGRDSSGNMYPGDGTVEKPAEKESYQLFDKMSIRLGRGAKYKPGDTVDIYSSLRFVRFRNSTANLVKRVGRGCITSVDGKRAYAQLFQISDVIKGKERTGLSGRSQISGISGVIEPDVSIKASVFERVEQTASPYLFQTVIIDQGSKKGVKLGDVFVIYHSENKDAAHPVMTGYVGSVTEESASLVIISIFENKVSSDDFAVLLCRSQLIAD